MRLTSIALFIFCIPIASYSQKSIWLLNRPTDVPGQRAINLSGAELYVFANGAYRFVSKTNEYSCSVGRPLDSLIKLDTTRQIPFIIRTTHFEYGVTMSRDDYLEFSLFTFGIIKIHHDGKNYLNFQIRYHETHGMGSMSPKVKKTKNNRWQKEYVSNRGFTNPTIDKTGHLKIADLPAII